MEIYMRLQLVLTMNGYLCLFCVTGDPVQIYPQLEYRNVPGDIRVNTLSFPNSNISPHSNHMNRQQIFHTRAMQSQPVPNAEKLQTKNSEFSLNDFLYTMNGLPEERHQNLRPLYRASENQRNYSLSNGYPRRNYDYWTSQESMFLPPTRIETQKTDKVLPKFNLIEPVTTKISGKMNGLTELVFALLGSGSNNVIMKGFKDIILDGIVRPLLVAKGGLKMLLSKLSIPLVSLLLINVEVLVTVWWLWEDCSAPLSSHPTCPSPPHSYNIFNNDNSTFR